MALDSMIDPKKKKKRISGMNNCGRDCSQSPEIWLRNSPAKEIIKWRKIQAPKYE